MRTEIPVCKRCCFCLPLRYGLIVWGYIRLCISLLILIFMCYEWYVIIALNRYDITTRVYTGVTTILTITDVVLSLILIVGGHKKNVKLLKIFYIYSKFLLGFTTTWVIYIVVLMINDFVNFTYDNNEEEDIVKYGIFVVTEAVGLISHLLLQLYMVLLVRSEFIKLNNGCQFRFVNHTDEAQCTLYIETVPTQIVPREDNEITQNAKNL